ncbi:hypothetical protein RND81_09G219700 [Saponaria officinalis]|uniref:Peptidase A1 domain-containing protein n=1 Tax=Saponaria officinalis TaxID=3572 RepID=A0AAW1IPD0_SAPOF
MSQIKMLLNSLLHLLLHIIPILYQANAFSMKIIPIDSPHLQILPKSFTVKERHHFLRNISLSRAFYAHKQNAKLGINSISSPLSNIQTSYFVTKLTFGTRKPAFSPVLVLDISADQTWIQCADCNPCFKLNATFPVEESSSYMRLDPSDTRCSPTIVYNGTCGFDSTFGSGHAQGYMGTDTFIFNETSGYFPNIAFGCGTNNDGFGFGSDPANIIAGVHGLGTGPRSMMTQLDIDTKGRFTYCIPSGNNVSTILFGDEAIISGDTARKLQTIGMNPKARYHLYLDGITVQETRLDIDPTLFELDDQKFSKGFFIDPSATFTVLTYSAYIKLKGALLSYFAKYTWDPLPSNTTIFDLCYPYVPDPSRGQAYPSVTFNFIKSPYKGAGIVKLLFDSKNIFGNFAISKGFCLQMLPTADLKDGPSILGAFQQKNLQFLFDINNRLLSFVPKKC